MKNQRPVRSGRSPSTRANTVNDSVVGESIAASAVRASSAYGELKRYLRATTIESGPTRWWTELSAKPTSRIHEEQSAPV